MEQLKTSGGRYVFSPDEWLTTSQIRSFFSRMRTTSIKTMDLSSSLDSSQRSFINDAYEAEHDIFDEGCAEVCIKPPLLCICLTLSS